MVVGGHVPLFLSFLVINFYQKSTREVLEFTLIHVRAFYQAIFIEIWCDLPIDKG